MSTGQGQWRRCWISRRSPKPCGPRHRAKAPLGQRRRHGLQMPVRHLSLLPGPLFDGRLRPDGASGKTALLGPPTARPDHALTPGGNSDSPRPAQNRSQQLSRGVEDFAASPLDRHRRPDRPCRAVAGAAVRGAVQHVAARATAAAQVKNLTPGSRNGANCCCRLPRHRRQPATFRLCRVPLPAPTKSR